MAEWWPFDRSWADDWKRTWTEIISRSSAAAASIGLPQPGTLPGDPFAVLVDAARAWLTGKKRTGELGRPSRSFAQAAWLHDRRGLQSNVARRIARRGRQHVANGTAREGEESEQESSATIVHGANLRCSLVRPTSKKRGNATTRRMSRLYCRTNATATSPTICSDSALTLSIVSSVV